MTLFLHEWRMSRHDLNIYCSINMPLNIRPPLCGIRRTTVHCVPSLHKKFAIFNEKYDPAALRKKILVFCCHISRSTSVYNSFILGYTGILSKKCRINYRIFFKSYISVYRPLFFSFHTVGSTIVYSRIF